MNIFIPDSWLREYIETDATPKQIAEYLSLTSATVERIEKVGSDSNYYLEVTTNRVDMMSVLGIARELVAILPQFGKKIKLKKNLPDISKLKTFKKVNYLDVQVDSSICPRFTAVLLEIEKIGKTPEIIVDRLNKVGVRSLNPIIDVTNYLMYELGQPMHVFDYDKISGHKMILRESRINEEVVTLDGVKRKLPKGSIVIEDGDKRLIDLCGIMGGENSCVDTNTKKILLFTQNYDPIRIRKTAQFLNFRTDAATLFEKGLDPETALPSLDSAISLCQKLLKVKKIFPIIDLYPKKNKPLSVKVSFEKIDKVIGLEINHHLIISILERLNFIVKGTENGLEVTPPNYRMNDVSIPEDIIEEVARIYGYNNLIGIVPQTDFLIDQNWKKLATVDSLKSTLANWGFNETYTYSMISEAEINKCNLDKNSFLKIANPLIEDNIYMRTSLIPSLLTALFSNQSLADNINFFELSRVYQKSTKDLPDEKRFLASLSNNKNFSEIKGIIEAVFDQLNVKGVNFCPVTKDVNLWQENQAAEIKINNELVGYLGLIKNNILLNFNITKEVVGYELDFEKVIANISSTKNYQPNLLYPAVIEDFSFIFPSNILVGEVINYIYKVSPLVKKVIFLDSYEDTRTFKVSYQSETKNLAEKDIKDIRSKIITELKQKFNLVLKGKS